MNRNGIDFSELSITQMLSSIEILRWLHLCYCKLLLSDKSFFLPDIIRADTYCRSQPFPVTLILEINRYNRWVKVVILADSNIGNLALHSCNVVPLLWKGALHYCKMLPQLWEGALHYCKMLPQLWEGALHFYNVVPRLWKEALQSYNGILQIQRNPNHHFLIRGLVKWKRRLEHWKLSVQAILYYCIGLLSDSSNCKIAKGVSLRCGTPFELYDKTHVATSLLVGDENDFILSNRNLLSVL